jgi:hypothetical protein
MADTAIDTSVDPVEPEVEPPTQEGVAESYPPEQADSLDPQEISTVGGDENKLKYDASEDLSEKCLAASTDNFTTDYTRASEGTKTLDSYVTESYESEDESYESPYYYATTTDESKSVVSSPRRRGSLTSLPEEDEQEEEATKDSLINKIVDNMCQYVDELQEGQVCRRCAQTNQAMTKQRLMDKPSLLYRSKNGVDATAKLRTRQKDDDSVRYLTKFAVSRRLKVPLKSGQEDERSGLTKGIRHMMKRSHGRNERRKGRSLRHGGDRDGEERREVRSRLEKDDSDPRRQDGKRSHHDGRRKKHRRRKDGEQREKGKSHGLTVDVSSPKNEDPPDPTPITKPGKHADGIEALLDSPPSNPQSPSSSPTKEANMFPSSPTKGAKVTPIYVDE